MNRSPSSKKEEIHSSNPSETTATNRKGYSRRLIADYTKQWGERERKHSQQAIATSWDVDLTLPTWHIPTEIDVNKRGSYISGGRNVIQREKKRVIKRDGIAASKQGTIGLEAALGYTHAVYYVMRWIYSIIWGIVLTFDLLVFTNQSFDERNCPIRSTQSISTIVVEDIHGILWLPLEGCNN